MFDGDPKRYRHWIAEPFAFWSIFRRRLDLTDTHGPERFNLLYLCADGVAAFQVLYVANNKVPKAISIIQPGHGFGGNWANYEDAELIFARSDRQNPAGTPDILLFGGIGERDFCRKPCWPEFDNFICFLDKSGGGSVGVWTKNS